MDSFFVLGQIPGTGITISFTMWLGACLATIVVMAFMYAHRTHSDPTHQAASDQNKSEVFSAITI